MMATRSIDVQAIENPGGDARLAMEWNTTYIRLDPGRCTFCARSGDDTIHDDLIVIRVEHEKMPLGYLESRCPEHQLRGERVRVSPMRRSAEPQALDGCEFPVLHDARLLCGCSEA